MGKSFHNDFDNNTLNLFESDLKHHLQKDFSKRATDIISWCEIDNYWLKSSGHQLEENFRYDYY